MDKLYVPPLDEHCHNWQAVTLNKRSPHAHPLLDTVQPKWSVEDMQKDITTEPRRVVGGGDDRRLGWGGASVERNVEERERTRRIAALLLQEKLLEEDLAKLDLGQEKEHGHVTTAVMVAIIVSYRSSTSSSGSWTPNVERVRHEHHTEEKKQVKKLNTGELIEASCSWYLDITDTTFESSNIHKHCTR